MNNNTTIIAQPHYVYSGFFISSAVFGFLGGVAVVSFVPLPPQLIIFSCFLVVLAVAVLISLENKSRRTILILIAFVALLACLLGMLRYLVFRHGEGDPELDAKAGEQVELTGMVSEDSVDTDDYQKTIVEIKPGIKVLVSADFYPHLDYGDRISFSGKLKKPEAFETERGTFDYPSFLAKSQIYYTLSYPKLTVLEKHQGSHFIETLFNIRHALVRNLQLIIPSPESGLIGGYLVEGKQSLSKSLQEEFKTVGVIHTVALSGFNVTIMVEAMMSALAFLPVSYRLGTGGVLVVLFTLMTGASSTVVRAAIMTLVAISAQLLGRSYNITRALVLAAFAMVVWNPMTLIYDPSFQLSFLATLGLVTLSPVLAPHLTWITERFKLRETVSSTLSAQLAVLPFILYSSGSLSLVALPANIIMLPFLPITMLFGSLAGGIAFISKKVAMPFAGLAYLFLHGQLSLVHFFAHIPYAAVTVPFPLWLMLASYFVFIFVLWKNSPRSPPN